MKYSLVVVLIISSYFIFPWLLDESILITSFEKQSQSYQLEKMSVLPLSKNRYPVKKSTDDLGPEITASSAIIVDNKTGQVLWQKNQDQILSLASLTKLATALVLIDLDIDWSRQVEMNEEDNNTEGARLYVPTGTLVSNEDLFRAMLVGSANNAVMALVDGTGIGRQEFVKKMNEKAVSLGLENTHFVEPTGLLKNNVSTVREYVRILREAFKNKKIREISVLENHLMMVGEKGIRVKNTNRMFKDGVENILASKTGYTEEAGYCLGLLVKNAKGNEVITLALNSRGDLEREDDSLAMIAWVFENYFWP